ncbi:GDSL-type esterase/lipase family protein [Sphingobacterium bovistauri]|uniref:GDSL family lipase n=1 Tax=Sphingobacterium bovistauri TaxID=2781959 RepID=A0ABS7Z2J6_9SPHI|nr:GDSL-type esterase/lipase family protein [Sphingobacterium bovistauri]MCA5004386.1 GDSL family lipase [Sphingobacterium bovistauri]
MKYFLILFSLTVMTASSFGQARDMSRDSSYNNWYYLSRNKLYSVLQDVKYDIVFFGNSITERGPWSELIGVKFKVGNRGIGGDNTFGMKARIQDAIKSSPKKIFLMMGINDVGRNLPTEWSLNNYEEIIKTIKKNSPKTKIYIQSVLPLNEKISPYEYHKGRESKVVALTEGVEALAKKYKLTYVNLREIFADGYVLKKAYTMDGIHINTQGYVDWVKYLREKKYL